MSRLSPAENEIIDTLDWRARRKFRRFIAWCERILDGTRYRVSLESFSIPYISGRRTVEQQAKLYARGRKTKGRKITNCDGVRKQSRHQTGKATHLGLRWRRKNASSSGPTTDYGRWIRHRSRDETAEQRQLFELMLAEAKRRGIVNGGRWRSLKDWHHFEVP